MKDAKQEVPPALYDLMPRGRYGGGGQQRRWGSGGGGNPNNAGYPKKNNRVDLVAVALIIAMIVDIRTMAMAVVEAGKLVRYDLPRDQ